MRLIVDNDNQMLRKSMVEQTHRVLVLVALKNLVEMLESANFDLTSRERRTELLKRIDEAMRAASRLLFEIE